MSGLEQIPEGEPAQAQTAGERSIEAASTKTSGAEAKLRASGPELSIIVPTLNERENIAPLVSLLSDALTGVAWEVIFVDDNSSDGTLDIIRGIASVDPRVRGIRRVGRRGLAGATIEGMLSSSAPYLAVMDADRQHDETRLIPMLAALREGEADLAAATRYAVRGAAKKGLSKTRRRGSRLATWLSRKLLGVQFSDPMSGFFMLKREVVDSVAPKLSHQGFKILLDILASAQPALRVAEIPFVFRPRAAGESKLNARVTVEYLGLLIAKATGDLVSIRFLMFGSVGLSGVIVQLAFLRFFLWFFPFPIAQGAAMIVAMASNYTLNNMLTYGDRKRTGWRFFTGLAAFSALCSVGLVAGIGVSTFIYRDSPQWWLAGMAGAVVGAMWNYVTSSFITWRER